MFVFPFCFFCYYFWLNFSFKLYSFKAETQIKHHDIKAIRGGKKWKRYSTFFKKKFRCVSSKGIHTAWAASVHKDAMTWTRQCSYLEGCKYSPLCIIDIYNNPALRRGYIILIEKVNMPFKTKWDSPPEHQLSTKPFFACTRTLACNATNISRL